MSGNAKKDYSDHPGRGGKTRGWKKNAPKPGKERNLLMEKCGKHCFLLPELKKFPICSKCINGICDCTPKCTAIQTAKIRASQHGYYDVRKKADKYTECN